MQISLAANHFILSPLRSVFWEEEKLLIISDAHFSKENHFRKNGIAVPSGILRTDLKNLDKLTEEFRPRKIIFLGDMFHSEENEGLNEFIDWRKRNAKQEIILIAGNHDILHPDWYVFAGIKMTSQILQIGNFYFTHERVEDIPDGSYNFSGHIHPCIVMRGNARQSVRLPCFWFGERHAVLPAYGSFTGSKSIRPKKQDQIIAIGDKELFRLQ